MDDMILYMTDPRKFYQKTSGSDHNFSKVAGYRINLQKPIAFLYTTNKHTGEEIMDTLLFRVASTSF